MERARQGKDAEAGMDRLKAGKGQADQGPGQAGTGQVRQWCPGRDRLGRDRQGCAGRDAQAGHLGLMGAELERR